MLDGVDATAVSAMPLDCGVELVADDVGEGLVSEEEEEEEEDEHTDDALIVVDVSHATLELWTDVVRSLVMIVEDIVVVVSWMAFVRVFAPVRVGGLDSRERGIVVVGGEMAGLIPIPGRR